MVWRRCINNNQNTEEIRGSSQDSNKSMELRFLGYRPDVCVTDHNLQWPTHQSYYLDLLPTDILVFTVCVSFLDAKASLGMTYDRFLSWSFCNRKKINLNIFLLVFMMIFMLAFTKTTNKTNKKTNKKTYKKTNRRSTRRPIWRPTWDKHNGWH